MIKEQSIAMWRSEEGNLGVSPRRAPGDISPFWWFCAAFYGELRRATFTAIHRNLLRETTRDETKRHPRLETWTRQDQK